ncbi:MAG: glycosyltransferase family 39 protein [Chthoniobacterales bacterium]|jgi:hypothetical protein|nr:glycosyltransferase family 39 protein [Chthoniobacterales bacterium]
MLGYFILQTYLSPQERQYQLNFGSAQWIEPAEVAPIAYFRKEIFLSHTPEQAWVEVAATDNFKLIVNGHTIGSKDSLKSRVAGIYDIKKPLKVGTNVIAVSISRTSFPGPAQLLACGLFKEPGAKVTSFVSDESWRVTDNTGIVQGNEEWTSARVEDELWPKARTSVIKENPIRVDWVDTNPLLFQLPSVGSWIMPERAGAEAIFSTSLDADTMRQETWIQVASSGDLDFLVNGHLVTLPITSSVALKRSPHLATAQPTPDQAQAHPGASPGAGTPSTKSSASVETALLAAYDISYWIKKGPNSIVVAVRDDRSPARLFADGFLVRNDGSVRRFMTDSHWRAGDQPGGPRAAVSDRIVETGKDGTAPWGYLPQEPAKAVDHSSFATLAKSTGVLLGTIVVTVALWLLISAIVAGGRREPLAYSMARDALFHGPIVVGLALLLLPEYDPRFPAGWSFRPGFIIGAIAILLAFRLLHLFANGRVVRSVRATVTRGRQIDFQVLLPYLLLAVIMGLGFGLRYHNLGYMSFDHDEMGLVAKSKGIPKLGFPYTSYAGEPRPATTYEAVPYPLALSGLLFGYSEWSMRLPSCLMGTLSIGILALMARRLFNWRTGLFAAFVYASLPLDIRWAQNAFYLTQCQLMSMLSIWLFYEAIRVRPLRRGYLTAFATVFCLTYLSWEGSGFLLPALFLGLVVIRWGEWWWLKEFHLYRCVFFIAVVVVAQYCSRTIAGSPYLQVGSGLSNLSGPSLFFLTPGYQPTFYIDKLWLAEGHVFFTILIFLGLPFCWRHRGFRYVFVVLVTLFVLHTNFLAALSPRYCYYFQPLLILGGVAAAMMLYDRLVSLAHREGDSVVARFAAHATGLALLALLFLQSNEWLMKEYKLSSTGDTPGLMTRLNTYRYDYRGAAQFVMSHVQPGDLIIPGIPHVFEYYAGRPGDYFLDTLLGSKIPYNQNLAQPGFVDKFAGLPAIRNLTELLEVTHRARRTWIIFAPYSSFEKLSNRNVLDYLDQNSKVEFESYRAKVLLVQGAMQPGSVAASR